MENVQLSIEKYGSLHFKGLDDTLLFTKLDHNMLLTTFLGKTGILDFTSFGEMSHYVVQIPFG